MPSTTKLGAGDVLKTSNLSLHKRVGVSGVLKMAKPPKVEESDGLNFPGKKNSGLDIVGRVLRPPQGYMALLFRVTFATLAGCLRVGVFGVVQMTHLPNVGAGAAPKARTGV